MVFLSLYMRAIEILMLCLILCYGQLDGRFYRLSGCGGAIRGRIVICQPCLPLSIPPSGLDGDLCLIYHSHSLQVPGVIHVGT